MNYDNKSVVTEAHVRIKNLLAQYTRNIAKKTPEILILNYLILSIISLSL